MSGTSLWAAPGSIPVLAPDIERNGYQTPASARLGGAAGTTLLAALALAVCLVTWRQIEPSIRPKIYYDSQTALICLENSSNMAGGTVYPTSRVDEICERAGPEGRVSGHRADGKEGHDYGHFDPENFWWQGRRGLG